MVEIYIKLIKAIGKEIKRLYRISKKLSDTDRYIITSFIFYVVFMFFIPLCIFVYLDRKGLHFLIFIPILIYLVFDRYKTLRKYDTRLREMSKNFKYYVSQRLITIATIYWTGEY